MNLLDAALAYAARGWSVIPVLAGLKRPAIRWKIFQTLRAGEAELTRWFGRDRGWQVGVVSGRVSGDLVVRDFDELEAYRRWAQAHPELAAALPTTATPRGRHVFFRAADLRFRGLPDGEYRGTGHYTLLPPSRHPNGPSYKWLIDLPAGELPLIDPIEAGLLPADPPIETAWPSQRPDRPTASWPPSGLTQRTWRFLANGAEHGHRNGELFCAACDMASKQIGFPEACQRLLEACKRCVPAYPQAQAIQTIHSAYGKARWQPGSADDPWGIYCIPRCIARRGDLTASEKLAWAALDYRQRGKVECWPSLETIGRDIGCCRATAAESVKRLEGKGLLKVNRTYGEPSRYTTHLPGSAETQVEGTATGPVWKADTNSHQGVPGLGTSLDGPEKKVGKT